MNAAKIQDTIKAREAEIQSVVSAFEKRKTEVQKIVDDWQQFGSQCQLKITHLQGCISELQRQLPKTADEKKAERKKKK